MTERKSKKKDKEATVNQETLAPDTTQTQIEPASLTMADLQALAQIVDVASRRGAFQGAELSSVGAAYDKLTTFLKYVAAQQEANKAAAEEETAPVAE